MVVDGPTICFFKSLDNNMVNTLGIDVYLNIQKSVQNKSLIFRFYNLEKLVPASTKIKITIFT